MTSSLIRQGGYQLSYGFYDGDDGYYGTILLSILITAIDDLVRHERAYTVVHSHESLGSIDKCQAILHGMEAGGTTIGNAMGYSKLVLSAELLPVGLMVVREHEDNLYGAITRMKGVERAHQHRTTLNRDKLLGQLTAHTEALAPGYDNGVLIHE